MNQLLEHLWNDRTEQLNKKKTTAIPEIKLESNLTMIAVVGI
ncbi:hypothetical protein [Flavobacterium sp. RSP49]|nr:hypothetical protein [Flavobacterium sp. RSP49]